MSGPRLATLLSQNAVDGGKELSNLVTASDRISLKQRQHSDFAA